MNSDDLSARLQHVIFSGGSDQQVQMIFDEFVDSDEERTIANKIQEDLLLAYTIAKQERAKVIDQLLIGCFIFLLSLGATIYTLIVIQRISLWISGALIVSAVYAVRRLIRLQAPLEDFVPAGRIIRRAFNRYPSSIKERKT